jgi:hypothetical protein
MWKQVVVGILVLASVGACYPDDAPGPTPGSMDDVIAAIVLQGITVQHLVSGDPGCNVASLHEDAVHMTLAVGEQTSAPFDVYFFNWKNQAKFDAAAPDFAACMADYENARLGGLNRPPLSVLTAYPWRACGPGWTSELYSKLAGALTSIDGTVSPSASP